MFFNGITPEKDKCCGCSACVKICPRKALEFKTDGEGFEYPVLNPEACIECGLCEKVCPMVHPEEAVSAETGHAYAAVCKNTGILKRSSSGGIFGVLASYVIESGGIVYGAYFDKDMKVRHIGIEKGEDIEKLQSSKYVQSQNGDVYPEIRQYLKSGRIVYYCGVGCQVAGLRLFLRRNYDNLLTTDILCHGVPPQRVFDTLIAELEKKHDIKITAYNFRDKGVFGWSCSSSSSSYVDSKGVTQKIYYDPYIDSYFNAYLDGIMYRESCYVCPFAQPHRAGDITLGDFWGVEKYIKIPDYEKGVSAIFVNTPKGVEMLDKIRSRIVLYDADIRDIRNINKTLYKPTPRPRKRDAFFTEFNRNPAMIVHDYAEYKKKRDLYVKISQNWFFGKVLKIYKRLRK